MAVDETLTLKEALGRMKELLEIHGETVPVRLTVKEHRTVRVSRKSVEEALSHPEEKTFLCLNLQCERVGQVFQQDGQAPNDHQECATYTITPPIPLDPRDQPTWIDAILEELTFGAPDSPYQPEADWLYSD